MASNKGKVKVVSVKSVRTEKDGDGTYIYKYFTLKIIRMKNNRPYYLTITGEQITAVDEEYGYRLKDVRNLFLQSLAGIYFIAFLSIYVQADGKFQYADVKFC